MPPIIESMPVESAPTQASARSEFAQYIGPVAVLAVGALLYWRIAVDMFNDWWTQENLSQGLLVVPFAAYIAWLRRKETLAHPVEADRRGLAAIAFGCFLYLLGLGAAEFFLCRISMLIVLCGCIWTFWGLPRMRSLGFPLVLFASAIPLPAIVYNTAAAPLQLMASDMATGLAQMAGITVYRDGNVINLAHMSLGVEEACSGLNSLSAMVAGGVLVAFLVCKRPWSRCVLLLSAIPIAVGANIIRVAGTAALADYNEALAQGFYHMLSGWLIFLLGFGALFAVAKGLAFLERRTAA